MSVQGRRPTLPPGPRYAQERRWVFLAHPESQEVAA